MEKSLTYDGAQVALIERLEAFYHEAIDLRQTSPFLRFIKGLFRPKRHVLSPPHIGLYIWGPPGRGKTQLMDMFLTTLPPGYPYTRAHFHSFMATVHQSLNTLKDSPKQPIQEFADTLSKTTKLLCFDEFQVTNIADAMILSRLFESLFDKGVRVILTSNVPPNDLYKGGLMRERFLPFINILKSRCVFHEMDLGQDYRFASSPQSQHVDYFYWPNSPQSHQSLRDLAKTFSPPSPPLTLNHQGRVLEVRESYGPICVLGFQELCDRPLGAEDYRVLGEAYPMVILTHIPKLTGENVNEMLRFMTLIDVWYDLGVKLFIASDGPLEEIYPDTAPRAEEFKRTRSRLRQMTSHEWHHMRT